MTDYTMQEDDVGFTTPPTSVPEPTPPTGMSIIRADREFINKTWRPMMAWTYMAICISDFILFPICWSLLQAFQDGVVSSQWHPITLEGAGLLHIAMGAVLGIAAYGRTKEKLQDRL